MVFDAQLVTALASVAFPTIAVVIGILVNNAHLGDMNSRLGNMNVRLSEFRADLNRRFDDTDRKILDTRELLRSEMFRMEQVFDARLKHIEEAR